MRVTVKNPEGFRRAMILFIGLAFGFLTIDTLVEHLVGMAPLGPFQWIPIVFSPLAMIAAVVTAACGRRLTVKLFQGKMLASLVVGLLGAFLHLQPFLTHFSLAAMYQNPPKFAPLAFAGIGLLGLLATVEVVWDRNEQKQQTRVSQRHSPLTLRPAKETAER